MITLNLETIELSTKSDVAQTLRELANTIEAGYLSGITNYGVCWDIEGEDEDDEDDDEVCPYCGDGYIVDSKNGLRRCMGCGNEF